MRSSLLEYPWLTSASHTYMQIKVIGEAMDGCRQMLIQLQFERGVSKGHGRELGTGSSA